MTTLPVPTITDDLRAEFEEWAKSEQGLDMFRLPHGGYRSFATHQAWAAWQASRKAVCVELPKPMPNTAGMDMATVASAIGFNHCLVYTRIALDRAGVAYK